MSLTFQDGIYILSLMRCLQTKKIKENGIQQWSECFKKADNRDDDIRNKKSFLQPFRKLNENWKNNILYITNQILFCFPNFKVDNRLKENFFEIKNISREKVNEIYKISDVLLFPSIYEGYGLPLVEALKSELPIVASNIATTKEILGKYPLLYRPRDFVSMSKAIIKILNNKNYLKYLKKILFIRSKMFNEEIYFKKLKKLYH